MKFYNLKFNANAPAAQQINVPTNTDYKLGVKVIQNGKELELSSSNVVLDNLSADEQKTNGYLTFTLSSDDNANIAQRQLSVDYTPLSAQAINIQKVQSLGVTITLSSDAPELIGKELTPKDYYASFVKPDTDTPPTSADVEASFQTYRDYYNDKPTAQTIVFAGTSTQRLYATCKAIDDAARNGQLVVLDLPPKGVDYFLVHHNIDQSTVVWKAVLSYTLKEDDQIQVPKISMARPFVYRGVGLKIQLGTPLNTTFKLVENVFKSQCGDISQGVDPSTVYTKGEVDAALSSKVTNLSSVSGIMKISQANYNVLSSSASLQLPASCFPVTLMQDEETITVNDNSSFEYEQGTDEINVYYGGELLFIFNKTAPYAYITNSAFEDPKFNGVSPVSNVSPCLELGGGADASTLYVIV